MDRMVPDPRTFKGLVEADLRRAARLIIKVQDEIDPQFRIATPGKWMAYDSGHIARRLYPQTIKRRTLVPRLNPW